VEATAEVLGEKGRATETITYANIVSFTCLKLSPLTTAKARR